MAFVYTVSRPDIFAVNNINVAGFCMPLKEWLSVFLARGPPF